MAATNQNAHIYGAVDECIESCIEKVSNITASPRLGIICLSIQAFLPLSKPPTLFHMSICQIYGDDDGEGDGGGPGGSS